jgi:hypothetical protein
VSSRRKLARTNAEAHLYMAYQPCSCGARGLAGRPRSAVARIDGDLLSRYHVACVACGRERTFEFRIPEQIMMPPAHGVQFGGDEPSELFDAGEWMLIADDHASRVPAVGSGPASDGADPERTLAIAVAALDEILKLIPPGADECPPSAFTSERGRAVRDAEPGRFRVARLRAVREVYASLARRN